MKEAKDYFTECGLLRLDMPSGEKLIRHDGTEYEHYFVLKK